MFLAFFALLVASILILSLYCKLTKGVYKNRPNQSGKVILITGGSAGIGLESAVQLAKLNATVILACRNEKKAKMAVQHIKERTGNPNVKYYLCDVALMRSVQQFSKEFLKNEQRLDVLLLNAGMAGANGRHLTEEGLEVHVATNHLGHFLLTNLLLDLLIKSGKSRIVIVSSFLHPLGAIHFDNFNCENYVQTPFFLYSNTKLMNVIFAKELSRRLEGTQVTANALNPGCVRTLITQDMESLLDYGFRLMSAILGKSVEDGAQTSVYVSIAEETQGVTGKYFEDCKISRHDRRMDDVVLGMKLWQISESWCQMALSKNNT